MIIGFASAFDAVLGGGLGTLSLICFTSPGLGQPAAVDSNARGDNGN